ncbi:RabGAP/TBC [Trametes coccinea BRFM310]|uniref:RabGAP/TBC n=1 Tax=Trametes coccinea (strain BRFM310) TaxID=1353009 RepID=A0A1Y2IJK8_TRAC3|nr:RabGAP/TBC [Trametes coccinea BRFM310]
MYSPSYVVVPPTPISTPHPPSPSPRLSRSKSDGHSLVLPELAHSAEGSFTDRERSSTETAIVTIYSMYEEDASSWSAPASSVSHAHHARPHSRPPSRTLNIKDSVQIAGAAMPNYRDSFLTSDSTGLDDSAFYDTTSPAYDLKRASMGKRLSAADKPRHSVVSAGSVQLAYADSRPPSVYRSSVTESLGNGAPPRRSIGSDSSMRRPSGPRSRPPSAYQHKSSHSQEHAPNGSSPHASLSLDATEVKPLPQTPPHTPLISPPSSPGTPLTPPPRPLHLDSYPSSPPEPSLQVPGSSAFSPSGSPHSSTSHLSTQSAVVRSEGEDADAFHVRSTYAQLETCGVKGDGIDEGVERTRARVGGSRASELRAAQALDDGSEKTRELTAQEIDLLQNLDRYGFFQTPSHDRLILLPAAPLQRPLSRISTANTSSSASPPLLPKQPESPPPLKELSRTAKWGRMLVATSRDEGGNIDMWGIKPSKERKLRERVYKGIPDCWRSAAWEVLMCRYSRTGKAELRQLMREYHDALDKPSSYDVQIDLDVPRTISGHVMFRTRYGQGQRSLFHVLHSLSLRCDTCGYCQGMGPIAATLLCYFEPERAYASLVRLHDSYNMHAIFSPGFPGLLEAIYVQERLTEQMLPAVYAAFKRHMVSTTSYATKWYITLFANSVPFQMQLRLWDAFLLEGHDIFVVVAVAIVWVYRDHITSNAANFETVLSLLSSFFVPEDENAVLLWIENVLGDKKLRSEMVRWRQDWNKLVESGEHVTALL